MQDLGLHLVVGRDAGCVVAAQLLGRLLQREVEVVLHHQAKVRERPLVRVRVVQEPRDVARVRVPILGRLVERRLVAALGGVEQLCGRQDVLREQVGELVPRGLAVEGLDRVADVHLVLQQPVRRRLQIGQVGGEADDEQTRPGHVVDPQLTHPVVECPLAHLGGVVPGGRMR